MKNKRRLAVIDIGTLKVKLLIAEETERGEFVPIYNSNTLTCLGLRINENGNRPYEENLEKTIQELIRCKRIIEEYGAERVRAVSTHALREMSNGREIAARISDRTGLKAEIISQEEEASLFFNAVVRDFQVEEDFSLADVGSGSVQLLIGNKKELKRSFLLKTGAQYLHDNFSPRHTDSDHPTEEEIAQMRAYILEQLATVPENINTPLIYGSSCIIDLFKTMGIPLENYSASKNHPFKCSLESVREKLGSLLFVPYGKREEIFRFYQKYYMWGVDKAFLNVLAIGERVSAPYIIPSNSNINQGLLLDLAKQ